MRSFNFVTSYILLGHFYTRIVIFFNSYNGSLEELNEKKTETVVHGANLQETCQFSLCDYDCDYDYDYDYYHLC